MSESQAATGVQVRRVWKYADEDEGTVHLMLASGDETLRVNLKQSRNPRMYDFIVGHSEVKTQHRPQKDAKSAE